MSARAVMAALSACLAVFPAISFSEDVPGEAPAVPAAKTGDPARHNHRGFFLSMGMGPTVGDIIFKASGTDFEEMIFSGGGATLDLKIGGAVMENLILSFDMITRQIVLPAITIDGMMDTAGGEVSAGDGAVGLGLTYYVMPLNVFVGATVGGGSFSMTFDGVEASSESGFAVCVKIGKEWWVSGNWGLGISGSYGYLFADDKADPWVPEYSGKLSTGKFSVMFNATYN